MTYRLRNIAIAVALAVLAAMMTSFYVKQQKQDIQQGQVLTTVWVAKSDIPAGSVGDDITGQLESTEVAKSAVTPGAIVQPEDLAGKVSAETIYAGEQVSLLRFSTEEAQGIRAQISGNLRAFQIPGDANQLLVGTLAAGDHVDIVGAWDSGGGGGGDKISRVVQLVEPPSASPDASSIGTPEERWKWIQGNPWDEGASWVRKEANDLFNRGAYEAAAYLFKQLEQRVSGGQKPLYRAFADLTEGYGLWHRFQYRLAWDKLKTSHKALEMASVWGGPPGLKELIPAIKANAGFLERLVLDPQEVKEQAALDLLAQARRRADHHGDSEGAMITLVRALEAFAQRAA